MRVVEKRAARAHKVVAVGVYRQKSDGARVRVAVYLEETHQQRVVEYVEVVT